MRRRRQWSLSRSHRPCPGPNRPSSRSRNPRKCSRPRRRSLRHRVLFRRSCQPPVDASPAPLRSVRVAESEGVRPSVTWEPPRGEDGHGLRHRLGGSVPARPSPFRALRRSDRSVRSSPGVRVAFRPWQEPGALAPLGDWPPPSPCRHIRRPGPRDFDRGRLATSLFPRHLLKLFLAHAGTGLLACPLPGEFGSHEFALLFGLGWHANPCYGRRRECVHATSADVANERPPAELGLRRRFEGIRNGRETIR